MRRAILFSAGMVVAGAALVLAASAAASGVRPGDGAAIRVASTDTMVAAVRPDDRAGIRGPGQLAPVEGVRPDDRAGVRGAGPVSAAPVTVATGSGSGIDWYDVGLGVLIGAGAILATLAIGYPLRDHVHRPHRPVHGH